MHGWQKQKLECALYVVATPIGNLRDITLRALDVLASVDTVAAEDTRNTSHLLSHYGISAGRLLALHQHNERAGAEKIIAMLDAGQAVALVSDAGTPAVSDPGALLVEAVRASGHRVIPVPGANAALAALSAAGLAEAHFLFYGFLPNKAGARARALQQLAGLPYPMVFYEAPHRVRESLADMQLAFGDARHVMIARELTKLFENFHACTLGEAQAWLDQDSNNLRGEFVLLVSGAHAGESTDASLHVLEILLRDLPLKQAVQLAVGITGGHRNELYQAALQLKQQQQD